MEKLNLSPETKETVEDTRKRDKAIGELAETEWQKERAASWAEYSALPKNATLGIAKKSQGQNLKILPSGKITPILLFLTCNPPKDQLNSRLDMNATALKTSAF